MLAACGRDLASRGFPNWDPPYPLERMRADAAVDELYAVRTPDDSVVATYALSLRPPYPDDAPRWQSADDEAIYLSRLAVLPAIHGGGIGAWCLAQVEERAAMLGRRAVRFDVYAPNENARAFYERRGYRLRGERSRKAMSYACYEKDVSRAACGGA